MDNENTSLPAVFLKAFTLSDTEKLSLALQRPMSNLCRIALLKTLGWLRMVKVARSRKQGGQDRVAEWKLLNDEIDKPLALPYFMVSAPRWNTHAIIATSGPLKLSGPVTFQPERLHQCAKVWCLVVYQAKGREVKAIVSSTDAASKQAEVVFTLDSAIYVVSLRLYKTAEEVVFPCVISESRVLLNEKTVASKASFEKLEKSVFHKHSYFYRLLNISALFNLATSNDEEKIVKNYLPVGSPETLYIFSMLKGKGTLTVNVPESLKGKCFVFLTVYNGSSFPVLSTELYCGEEKNLDFLVTVGTMLIRIIPTQKSAVESLEMLAAIRVNYGSKNSHES